MCYNVIQKETKDTMKFLNAREIFEKYRIPRSKLRELASSGAVNVVETTSGGQHPMWLYSEADVLRFVEEESWTAKW